MDFSQRHNRSFTAHSLTNASPLPNHLRIIQQDIEKDALILQNDLDADNRFHAAQRLGFTNSPEALEPLFAALNPDEHIRVLQAVGIAINDLFKSCHTADISPPPYLRLDGALRKLLRYSDTYAPNEEFKLLYNLGPLAKSLGSALLRASLQIYDYESIDAAAHTIEKVLGKKGIVTVAKVLVSRFTFSLGFTDARDRTVAIRLLSAVEQPEHRNAIIPILIKAIHKAPRIQHPDQYVSRSAAHKIAVAKAALSVLYSYQDQQATTEVQNAAKSENFSIASHAQHLLSATENE